MSNSASRVIGVAIAILAGGVLLGLGSIAQAINPNRGQEAQIFGFVLLLLGGLLLGIEFFVSIRMRD